MRRAAPWLAAALALCVGAEAWASDISRALTARARADMVEGDPQALERARDVLEQAVVLDPADARAFRALGRTHELAGRDARARAHYARALDMDPDDTRTLAWAGALDVRLGLLDEAEERIERLSLRCDACAEARELEDALAQARSEAESGATAEAARKKEEEQADQ